MSPMSGLSYSIYSGSVTNTSGGSSGSYPDPGLTTLIASIPPISSNAAISNTAAVRFTPILS